MSACRIVSGQGRVLAKSWPLGGCAVLLLGWLGFLALGSPGSVQARLIMVADAPAVARSSGSDADITEHGVRIERDRQTDIRIQRIGPEVFRPLPEADPGVNELLAEAWGRFEFEEYFEALALFNRAEDRAESLQAKQEARLGRAYAHHRLSQMDMARELFASLLREGYRREEVGPALAWVLLELELPSQAADVLEELERAAVPVPPEPQEVLWREIQRRLAAPLPGTEPDVISLSWQNLDRFAPGTSEYRLAADRLLAKAPNDAGLRERLAWDALRAGLYPDALPHFATLTRLRPQDVTGLQGHATTLERLGRGEEAIDLLEQARPANHSGIRAQLAGLYATEGHLAYQAGEDQRAAAMLIESLLLDPADTGRRELLAWVYLRQGKQREARNLFQGLRGDRPGDPDLLLGEALSLRSLGRHAEALALLDAHPMSEDALETLRRDLAAELAEEALTVGDYQRAEQLYVRLLVEQPTRAASIGLAWTLLRQERPAQARDLFLELLAEHPGDSEALSGAIAAWRTLGRPDAALALLEAHERILSVDQENLRADLLLEYAVQLRTEARNEEAVAALRRSLVLDPEDPEVLDLLAWTLFDMGRFAEAREQFAQLFGIDPTPRRASAVLLSHTAQGDMCGAESFAGTLAGAEDQALRAVAAEYYLQDGRSIRAAQVDARPGTRYAGCADPAVDSFATYRSRDGDRGLTRLGVAALPTTLVMPETAGGAWSLHLEPQHYATGDAPQRPFSGSFYKTVQDPDMRPGVLETSAQVLTAELRHVSDGPVRRTLAAGSTAIGGPIAPRPTFLVRLEREKKWFLEGRQRSVGETFLSALGRSDPYGPQSWGRVLETGLHAGWTISVAAEWWVNLEAEYGYLWGENVADNHRLGGALSLGRSNDVAFGTLSTGLFVAVDHYDRNQNHQTFGHGGYFSPEHFFIAGPFLHVSSTLADSDLFVEARLSLGYMHYQSASAPRYRKTGESPDVLSDSARQELFGRFPGERESGLAVNAEAELFRKIALRWDIGGFGGVNSASDHTQWHVGIGLRFALQPRGDACRLRLR